MAAKFILSARVLETLEYSKECGGQLVNQMIWHVSIHPPTMCMLLKPVFVLF